MTMIDLTRFAVVGLLLFSNLLTGSCNLVFQVEHKFKGREKSLSSLKAHDMHRHGRFLSAIDLELGGNGQPSQTGLYFAKIGLGTPPKDYYVQVDTGSDILWVNCAGCADCPKKSDLGMELTLFDPKSSSTSSLVTCDQAFCVSTYSGPIPGCKVKLECEYKVVYGDESSTSGYFVKDYVQLDKVTGNRQTSPTNGSIIFGCGDQQAGQLKNSAEALDGILGFGQANSSMISQLASSGKVKKIFSHCLDVTNGGGIFSIGEVVHPLVNKTTPLVRYQSHYNVVLKDIGVGDSILNLPSDVFDTDYQRGTVIDSGTTLAYLPEAIYEPLTTKILEQQPGLSLHTVEDQFSCFQYTDNVDDAFPTVTFYFQGSLTLTVFPHEYLFQSSSQNVWCIGWQNSGTQPKDGRYRTLLGDLVLQNKLVLYNLEDQTIGWTPYNCSSSIQVRDDTSKAVYTVGAHNLPSGSSLITGSTLTFLLLIIALLHSYTN